MLITPRMEPHVQLMRPLNSAMGAVAVLAGALVAVGPRALSSGAIAAVALAAAVAFLYTAGGNALNDYIDRRTDRTNHPRRPIPSRRIRAESARKFSIGLFAAGMMAALFIGFPRPNAVCVFIAVLNCFLLAGYELKLKSWGFPGNLTVSWLTASLFLFGGAAAQDQVPPTLFPPPVLALALLAFLASVGREIVKGIEDVKGDRDRLTLPRVLGVRRSGQLAAVWILLAVGFSGLPVYPLGIFWPQFYLPIVALADGIFIYSVLVLFGNPGKASQATKLAMLVALAAFLAGALVPK
jgi:geranylgeranylglycerol-phosphate geranylgeranyltransferase